MTCAHATVDVANECGENCCGVRPVDPSQVMLHVLSELLADGSGEWTCNDLGRPWRENVLKMWATQCRDNGLTTSLSEWLDDKTGVRHVLVGVSGVRVRLCCYPA